MQDGSETTDSGASRVRHWLRFGGKTIPLALGSFTIGRHASCALTFEDALVSRRHAELTVDGDGAAIADLDSANGVWVNGERVTEPRRLEDGDRILIGSHELVLVRGNDSSRPREEAPTSIGGDAVRDAVSLGEEDDDVAQSSVGRTKRVDALDVLGGVAQKMLARGQNADAERVLTAHLTSLMQQARAGLLRDAPDVLGKAATQALRLCAGTKKASWANYAVALYECNVRPMPGESIDELYALARSVPPDLALLRRYLAALRASSELGANDKFLLRRLEGLEQLVAST